MSKPRVIEAIYCHHCQEVVPRRLARRVLGMYVCEKSECVVAVALDRVYTLDTRPSDAVKFVSHSCPRCGCPGPQHNVRPSMTVA